MKYLQNCGSVASPSTYIIKALHSNVYNEFVWLLPLLSHCCYQKWRKFSKLVLFPCLSVVVYLTFVLSWLQLFQFFNSYTLITMYVDDPDCSHWQVSQPSVLILALSIAQGCNLDVLLHVQLTQAIPIAFQISVITYPLSGSDVLHPILSYPWVCGLICIWNKYVTIIG